ncbi:MAG: YtxH domain-containing protein [Vampirovibrionales bacterium]|nr:YtxH domain-containing protein [Vampirovibrionales bacterium]
MRNESNRHEESAGDDVFAFSLGLLVGGLFGSALALLLAPMSGREMRHRVRIFVESLPERVEDEMDPASPTRQFIDRTRVKIENRVEKAQHDRYARRVADAKQREESASGAH